MSATLGIGIIGTGSIVGTYIKCINELEEAHLVGLYSTSSTRANAVEAKFGVPVFTDLERFLQQPQINLICVCNQSGHHEEAIKRSAQAGKHVLCEKPLEVTPEKIDDVIEACKKHHIILGCVLQNRCGEAYLVVEKTIREGKLGKLLMGNAHINWFRTKDYYRNNSWRGTKKLDGGAAFINQGIHTIDLLVHAMGPVISVFGNMKTLVHDIEGEDVGVGILNFSNGAIGTITAGTALYPGYPERLEFFGENGSIIMEGGAIVHWNVRGVPQPRFSIVEGSASGATNPENIGHINHKIVIRDMIGAINDKREPMVDGEEAKKAVSIITALYRSSEQEKLIYL